MKKIPTFFALAAAAFALSIDAGGCAKEKAPASPEPARKEAAGKDQKAAPLAGVKWFSGTIEALDVGKGTLTLKGPKESMDFRADKTAMKDLADLEIGDKVIVKHTGKVAHSVVKPGAHHAPGVEKEKRDVRKEEDLVRRPEEK